MDDTVLFLSAYNSTQYKATNWFLRKLRNVIPHKKKQMQPLLENHHLSFVATDETHWSFRIILKIFQITFANSLIRKRLLNQLRTLVQWKYTNIIHKLVVV